MQRLSSLSLRDRYRVGAAASLLAALLGAFLFMAPSAFAHHPTVSGETACNVGGGYTSTFTSVSWQQSGGNTGGGANPHIDIYFRFRQGNNGVPTAWTMVPWQTSYKYTAQNGYQFSDTIDVPDLSKGNQIQYQARAVAPWGNGTAGGQTTDSEYIPFPTNCVPVTTTTTAPPTTTTTAPPTTTTTAPPTTTTTAPPTTTTTAPPTTTTTPPTTKPPTTTTPPTTAPPTTKPPTTTTPPTTAPPTTKPPTTTTPPTTAPPTTKPPTTTTPPTTEPPTTTTAPTTSTTLAGESTTTTSTPEETTTTTAAPTTSTTVCLESTTTTAPGATSTTAPGETTSSTTPDQATTTIPLCNSSSDSTVKGANVLGETETNDPTVAPTATVGGVLPTTGVNTFGMVLVAVSLLTAGFCMVQASRPARRKW
jgi:hypothetical protein